MEKFLGAIRRQVSEFLEKTSKRQKIGIGVAIAAVVVVAVIASVLLSRVQYTVLYTGLDESEAGKIMAVLEDKGVKAKAESSGTILVPSEGAEELRMELAADGYPKTGLNYDIFSNASGFGTTDMEKKAYYQYQLQENLRTTILKMDKIKDCMVIVNMATDSSFVLSDEQKKASASVMLELKDGDTLTDKEAKAIGELVTTSVPDLDIANVRLVDSQMKLYDLTGQNSDEDDTDGGYTDEQYNLTKKVRDTMSEQVLSMLEPAFGKGNVSASVNVALNFDKQTVDKVEFAPPVEDSQNGLAVSMEELYQKTQDGTGTGGTAGTDSNGLNTPEYNYTEGETASGDYDKISRTVNYELNQTRTQIEKAKGHIENLSVAVLINSGAVQKDYTDSVKQLVASAIGVDQKYVTVQSMPFVTSGEENSGQSGEAAAGQNASKDRDFLMEILVAVLAAALIIVAVRALGRKKKPQEAEALPESEELPPENEAPLLGGRLDLLAREDEEELPELDVNFEKSSSAKQIEKFVDKDPKAVAQLLRNWLSDDR